MSGHNGTGQVYQKHDFIKEFLSIVFRKVEGFNPHTAVHPLRLLDPYCVVGLVIVRLASMANMPSTNAQKQFTLGLKYILYKNKQ